MALVHDKCVCVVAGTVPVSLSDHTALVYVYLEDNSFHGTNVTGFFPAGVTSIDISGNLFSGHFAFGASNFAIEYLYLSRNYFSGTIPTDLAILAPTIGLDMSHNYFSGTVPSQLSTVGV